MRYPQIVILESDGWMAKQLRHQAGEHRWLIREPRRADRVLMLLADQRPTVLFLQFEPGSDRPDEFTLVAEVHRLYPDIPVVAVSEVKLPDADRTVWGALILDLGARYVLFPPISRPILDDLASGLMAAAVQRSVGGMPAPLPAPSPGVIDLADEGVDG